MIKKDLIKYWKETAKHDYKTMEALFNSKRYSDSLFYGHIVLEKIIKSLIVKNTGKVAPRIHDLVRLVELAKEEFEEEEIFILNRINTFNIRARYPEYELNFYKICSKGYAQDYLDKIKKLYKKICQKLK